MNELNKQNVFVRFQVYPLERLGKRSDSEAICCALLLYFQKTWKEIFWRIWVLCFELPSCSSIDTANANSSTVQWFVLLRRFTLKSERTCETQSLYHN